VKKAASNLSTYSADMPHSACAQCGMLKIVRNCAILSFIINLKPDPNLCPNRSLVLGGEYCSASATLLIHRLVADNAKNLWE